MIYTGCFLFLRFESYVMTRRRTSRPSALTPEPERRWLVRPTSTDDVIDRSTATVEISQNRWKLNPSVTQAVRQICLASVEDTADLQVALEEATDRTAEKPFVRLRRSKAIDGPSQAFLAVKAGRGLDQVEFERPVHLENVAGLLALRPFQSSTKTRYQLSLNALFDTVQPTVRPQSYDLVCDVFQLTARARLKTPTGALLLPRGPAAVIELEQKPLATADEQRAVAAILAAEAHRSDSVFQVELTPFRGIVQQIAQAAEDARQIA